MIVIKIRFNSTPRLGIGQIQAYTDNCIIIRSIKVILVKMEQKSAYFDPLWCKLFLEQRNRGFSYTEKRENSPECNVKIVISPWYQAFKAALKLGGVKRTCKIVLLEVSKEF